MGEIACIQMRVCVYVSVYLRFSQSAPTLKVVIGSNVAYFIRKNTFLLAVS